MWAQFRDQKHCERSCGEVAEESADDEPGPYKQQTVLEDHVPYRCRLCPQREANSYLSNSTSNRIRQHAIKANGCKQQPEYAHTSKQRSTYAARQQSQSKRVAHRFDLDGNGSIYLP